MQKIRQKVFETNSSSTHSISISEINEGTILDIMIPNENGDIVLNGGEFGWYEDVFYDAWTKANYAAIYVMDWAGEESESFKQILIDVIKEQTGCYDVIFNFTDCYSDTNEEKYWAYIDHQSVEEKDLHYLFEEPSKLRNFIFNNKSYLVTDSDN